MLFCFIFVGLILGKDLAKKASGSSSLWLPLAWLLLLSSRSIVFWIHPELLDGEVSLEIDLSSYGSGSPVDRLIYSALIVAGLVVLVKRSRECFSLVKNNKPVIFLLIYCGISIVWSDIPLVALKRWIRALGSVIMILIVLTENDPVFAIKTVIRRWAYIVVPFSVVLIRYFPQLSIAYDPWGAGAMFLGVSDNKNGLGRICLLAGLYFFVEFVSRWKHENTSLGRAELLICFILSIMVCWLFIKADSVTSILCLIVAIIIMMSLELASFRQHIGIVALCVGCTFVVAVILFDTASSMVGLFGRDLTFTGRVQLWKDLFAMRTDLLLGAGYASFWSDELIERLSETYWQRPNEAHNGYLEIYLQVGLIGILFWVWIILSTYKKIKAGLLANVEFAKLQLAFFALYLLYNFTEAALDFRSMLSFSFLLITLHHSEVNVFSEDGTRNL